MGRARRGGPVHLESPYLSPASAEETVRVPVRAKYHEVVTRTPLPGGLTPPANPRKAGKIQIELRRPPSRFQWAVHEEARSDLLGDLNLVR